MDGQLLGRFGELLTVAGEAATDDIPGHVETARFERDDVIERTLPDLQADAAVVAGWMLIFHEIQVSGRDVASDTERTSLRVIRRSESDEPTLLR